MLSKLIKKYLNKPKTATSEEWEAWDASYRKNKPIVFWLLETIPSNFRYIIGRLKDVNYYILYRIYPKYWKYWIVKPTTLNISYHDTRDLILHTNMQLLSDFYLFQISSDAHTCWDCDEKHKEVLEEMGNIFVIWRQYLVKKESLWVCPDDLKAPSKPFDKLDNFPEYKLWLDYCANLENELDNQEDDLLHRLINIRQYLCD